MKAITTIDFSDFSQSQREEAVELLTFWNEDNLPEDFENNMIQIMLNHESGYVFLTNSEYQVAMVNPSSKKLESWYYCPICGHEGFKGDFNHNNKPGNFDAECCEWLIDIGAMQQEELGELEASEEQKADLQLL